MCCVMIYKNVFSLQPEIMGMHAMLVLFLIQLSRLSKVIKPSRTAFQLVDKYLVSFLPYGYSHYFPTEQGGQLYLGISANIVMIM